MRRVIKVGGSLLLRSDLTTAIHHWLSQQSQAESLVIVGGGEMIDAMRNLDQVRDVDPTEMHWICVDLLETTFRLFSQWFDWPCVATTAELQVAIDTGFSVESPTLVSVSSFYHRQLGCTHGVDIPCDWRTTTDTIAALLAVRSDADELVLLKSCDVAPNESPKQLADDGVVDEAFPIVAPLVKSIRVEKLAE